jgi:hypothetical protein
MVCGGRPSRDRHGLRHSAVAITVAVAVTIATCAVAFGCRIRCAGWQQVGAMTILVSASSLRVAITSAWIRLQMTSSGRMLRRAGEEGKVCGQVGWRVS